MAVKRGAASRDTSTAKGPRRGARRSEPTPPPWIERRRAGTLAALVFVLLFLPYLSNLRVMGAADSLPTRRLPFSILQEGDIDLDEFDWEMRSDGSPPYYLRRFGEHFYSGSPIATPLLITPLYLVPAWFLSSHGIAPDDVRTRVVTVAMERVSAATMTALAFALLFVVLCRFTDRRRALALAMIGGLGSSSWSIASQALWPHALAELSLAALCLLLLVPEPSRPALVLAAVVASLAVVNRPPMVIFAALAFFYVWRHQRPHRIAFSALPAICAAAFLAYNVLLYGRLAGNYGVSLENFSPSVVAGVAGLLVSPNRGLFVYSPLFLFAVVGALRVWRAEAHPWLRYLTVGLVLHVLFYGSFKEWWAGYTFGPRYFTDVVPVLTLLLVPGLLPFLRRTALRLLAGALALYGVGVQAVGVYCAENEWNRLPVSIEQRPERVWDWSDLQIVRGLHNGWHGGDLLPLLVDVFRDPVPALLRPLAAEDLAADFDAADVPAEMHAGERHAMEVAITNRGQKAWPAFSGEGRVSIQHLVVVVVRWEQGGQTVAQSGDVLRLPSNVAPGETLRLPVVLQAPPKAGEYEVDVRPSQAIDRFRGMNGPNALRFPVVVR